jgi:hypothetical protein
MLNELAGYLAEFWQPLSGLVIGTVILAFIGCINWYGTVKKDTVRWIAKHFFHNEFRSEASADGLFMVATGFLLLIAGTWVIAALVYLGLL